MDTSYSVQQIKFEFLSYIKEFGGDGSEWTIGLMNEDEQAKVSIANTDRIWISKPALSPNAARLVADYFISRFGAKPDARFVPGQDKNWVHMFVERKTTQL